MVQFFVVSTGGFFSPLLILFHIYGLLTGFFLSFWGSLTFLVLSVGILIGQIILSPLFNAKFSDDPFYVILYLISFLIIIPVIQYASKTYTFKSALLDKLNDYLKYTQAKDQLIMGGLKDMVFTLDDHFNIISVNGAVQKAQF